MRKDMQGAASRVVNALHDMGKWDLVWTILLCLVLWPFAICVSIFYYFDARKNNWTVLWIALILSQVGSGYCAIQNLLTHTGPGDITVLVPSVMCANLCYILLFVAFYYAYSREIVFAAMMVAFFSIIVHLLALSYSTSPEIGFLRVTFWSKPRYSTVYWVPNGYSYHSTKSCPSLARSSVILSGTMEEASEAGKTDPCDNCT